MPGGINAATVESDDRGVPMRARLETTTVGFLLVQAVIGYEWLASGLTKVVHGDFPAGLAQDLQDRAKHAAHWYRRFLDGAVIPHATTFGYLIEIVELAIGVILIGSSVLWLWRHKLSPRLTRTTDALAAGAAFAGLLLGISLVLANRATFWLIGPDSFDEGITLDALIVLLQAILLGVSIALFARPGHRSATDVEPGTTT